MRTRAVALNRRFVEADNCEMELSEDSARLLADLEEEERTISLRRRRLHDRLALYPETATDDVRQQERELSARRRDLHAKIDALRRTNDRLPG